MSETAEPSAKKRRLQYDRENLQRALDATKSGMSAYRAAKLYSVPPTTLRDRISGRIAADAKVGHETIFTQDEEQNLYEHITYMATIGFGYNKTSIQYMAKDYADCLGKFVKAQKYLSDNWFYGFTSRWPSIKKVKPQKLSIARAKSTSRDPIDRYYKELDDVLSANHLKDKPFKIFNIDAMGVNTEHTPPEIICEKDTVPQNVTSARSSTVTVIAAGNAVGQIIPPYYIFPGQRWNENFLKGACNGSTGEMSKTGLSNSAVFVNYLINHFTKYVATKDSEIPTLILYDGHRFHISLTLTEWAKLNNVILFVLPPQSNHVTQPLDVEIFGPFIKMFSEECQKYMKLKLNPGVNITKYEIAELTSKPYMRALTPENLTSVFRRTGIFPFCSQVITDNQLTPSTIYSSSDDSNNDTYTQISTQPTQHTESNVDFFAKRTKAKAIPKPKHRKFVPPFNISGNFQETKNIEILTNMTKHKQDVCVEEPTPSTSGCNRSEFPIN